MNRSALVITDAGGFKPALLTSTEEIQFTGTETGIGFEREEIAKIHGASVRGHSLSLYLTNGTSQLSEEGEQRIPCYFDSQPATLLVTDDPSDYMSLRHTRPDLWN